MYNFKSKGTIYQFPVNFDILEVVINDFSNRVCVPNKTEDLNLRPFNRVTGIKGYNLLTKHISSKCEYQASIKQMLA